MMRTRAEGGQSGIRSPVCNASTSAPQQPRSKIPVKKTLPGFVSASTSKPVSPRSAVPKASAVAITLPCRDQTPQVNNNSNNDNNNTSKKTVAPSPRPAFKTLTLVSKYFPASVTPTPITASAFCNRDQVQAPKHSRIVPVLSTLPQATTSRSSSSSSSSSTSLSSVSLNIAAPSSARSLPRHTRTSKLTTPAPPTPAVVKPASSTSAWAAKSSPQRAGTESSAWNMTALASTKTSPVAAKPRAGVWY
jgi:hypothetical protein